MKKLPKEEHVVSNGVYEVYDEEIIFKAKNRDTDISRPKDTNQ